MVIRPLSPAARSENVVPVWQAIEARQRQLADTYCLVAQPDHARLSGELAAHFARAPFPALTPDVVKAIGLHDSGWAIFAAEHDAAAPAMTNGDGKPRSFIEFAPADFTRAWAGSIARAAEVSHVGGCVVGCHFLWLGEMSSRARHAPEQELILRRFLDEERARQQRVGCGQEAAELLTALQFCDLLSLYLCCGAEQPAEFPQQFAGHAVRIRKTDAGFELTPSPFAAPVQLHVNARRFPANGAPEAIRLHFVIS